jgi:lipopolysaccharide export LptBFGC system permease protein LptF
MLRSYTKDTLLVASALLTVALTLDLSPRFSGLLQSRADESAIFAIAHVGWYTLLRSADIMAEFLPISCFLGVVWCEISHIWSRERLMVWSTGRSPWQSIVPALLFAAMAGGWQFALDVYLRPAAVMSQMQTRLGDYGARFDRRVQPHRWMTAGTDLMQARIEFGPPPVLHDITIYRLDTEGHLQGVVTASTAVPIPQHGRWLLHRVRNWDAAAGMDRSGAAPPTDALIGQREYPLKLDPTALSYSGIPAKFLPHPVVASLANASDDVDAVHDYRTWNVAGSGRALFVMGMVLVAWALSSTLLAQGTRFDVVLGIGLVGYGGQVLMKVFIVLGEHGFVRPLVAAWSVSLLMFLVCFIALVAQGRSKLAL